MHVSIQRQVELMLIYFTWFCEKSAVFYKIFKFKCRLSGVTACSKPVYMYCFVYLSIYSPFTCGFSCPVLDLFCDVMFITIQL